MTTTQKCEHPGCNCQSTAGKKHCGTDCADTTNPKAPCDCKHPECKETGLKM